MKTFSCVKEAIKDAKLEFETETYIDKDEVYDWFFEVVERDNESYILLMDAVHENKIYNFERIIREKKSYTNLEYERLRNKTLKQVRGIKYPILIATCSILSILGIFSILLAVVDLFTK